MRDLSKIEVKINAKVGKAITDHNLIGDGDRILVAVSGGKDSLALIRILKKIQRWAPVNFSLFAAHITTDIACSPCLNKESLRNLFQGMGVDCFFSHVDVLNSSGETSCFWCSWNKRKALFEIARQNGFNKVAFGHHKDDIAQTVLLNLFFKGEISAINPRQELFEGKLTLIRPLCYVEERLLQEYALESGLSPQASGCSYGDMSKRQLIKDIIFEIESKTPGTNIKTNIFNAINRIKRDYVDVQQEKDLIDIPVLSAIGSFPQEKIRIENEG